MPLNTHSSICRNPFYFGEGSEQMYAVLHRNNEKNTCSDTALIICPPPGIEYMNSHRSLRHLADALALQGTDSLRLDYVGTGDSADGMLDNDISSYIASIERAYRYLSDVLGYQKVALLGLRFGATLAALAAEKLNIDFLILWAPVLRGRNLLREIRLIQKTNAIIDTESDFLEAGGWVINQQTQTSIESIDLNQLTPQTRQILLLTENLTQKEQKLINHWKNQAIDVSTISVAGTAEILVDAHETIIPRQAINDITAWAETLAKKINSPKPESILPRQAVLQCRHSLTNEPFNIHESLHFIQDNSDLFYVKTTPIAQPHKPLPIVILLNSGSNHHAGPHRLYTTICRLLANEGFTCIRLDLPGLGESSTTNEQAENSPYMVNPSTSIKACIDHLTMQNDAFILMGLCSGAYHAFLAAIELDKSPIVESILINPLTYYWEQGMVLEDAVSVNYGEWSWYKQAIKNTDKWKKLLTGQTPISPIVHSVIKRIATIFKARLTFLKHIHDHSLDHEITPDITRSLDKISQRNTHLTLFFSQNDPGENILFTNAARRVKKLQQQHKLELKIIERADHTFSKSVPRRQLFESIHRHFISRYLPNPQKELKYNIL